MKRIIGIILIVAAGVLCYFGIQQYKGSTKSAEVAGIELSANDKGGQTTAYIEFAAAAVSLIAGIGLVSQKK